MSAADRAWAPLTHRPGSVPILIATGIERITLSFAEEIEVASSHQVRSRGRFESPSQVVRVGGGLCRLGTGEMEGKCRVQSSKSEGDGDENVGRRHCQ